MSNRFDDRPGVLVSALLYITCILYYTNILHKNILNHIKGRKAEGKEKKAMIKERTPISRRHVTVDADQLATRKTREESAQFRKGKNITKMKGKGRKKRSNCEGGKGIPVMRGRCLFFIFSLST